jgi:hypothetical protein
MRIGRNDARLTGAAVGGPLPVELTFRWADLPLRQFDRAQWRHGFLRLGVSPIIMWTAVFLTCLAFSEWIEALMGPRWVGTGQFVMIGAGFGALAAFAGFLGRWTVMQRAARRVEIASGLRAGEHLMTLGPAGVRMVSDHADVGYGWDAVASVGQAPGGLVLRLGTRDYLPVPDAALPQGVTREELLDRIHRWMAG